MYIDAVKEDLDVMLRAERICTGRFSKRKRVRVYMCVYNRGLYYVGYIYMHIYVYTPSRLGKMKQARGLILLICYL